MTSIILETSSDLLVREFPVLWEQLSGSDEYVLDIQKIDTGASKLLVDGNVQLEQPFAVQDIVSLLKNLKNKQSQTEGRIFYIGRDIVVDRYDRVIVKQEKNQVDLTEKEIEILYLLSVSPDHSLSKIELLKQVWGYHEESETHTVETHIYRLRKKLEDLFKEDLIITEPGGYKINPTYS